MKSSTEDLHEKHISGYTINEISQETGISRWTLYKRFQRMKNSESTQENNSEEDTILKNIISNTNEFQTRINKWSDTILAILYLASIFVVFFLYRKYNSEKIRKSTE